MSITKPFDRLSWDWKGKLNGLIPPNQSRRLAITQAASGTNLTAFREAMDYDNLIASFSRTSQYEAAGAVWMVDPISSDIDHVSVSQLEGAMGGMG